jgi:class 3 adenylate cyclase
VRIGVHAGDAVDDGQGDIIGRVVNLAARVTSEAEPGQILITEPVADHVDKDTKLEDRGLVMLRGISQPRHLLAVSWD